MRDVKIEYDKKTQSPKIRSKIGERRDRWKQRCGATRKEAKGETADGKGSRKTENHFSFLLMKQDYYLRAVLDRTRLPKNQQGKNPDHVPIIQVTLTKHAVN